MKFSDFIKKYRVSAGLSQKALADACGLSRQKMCDIEKGRWKPIKKIPILAKNLNISIEKLTAAYFE